MNFDNPLTFGSIPELLLAVLNVFIIISIPIVIFFLILSGFNYVTARGNPEKISKASKSLMYGVIGGVIILSSVAIMKIVQDVVSSF